MKNKATTSKPLIIKIIGYSFDKLWYKDFVGFEFVVDSHTTRDYYIFFDGYMRGVLCKDAIIVN